VIESSASLLVAAYSGRVLLIVEGPVNVMPAFNHVRRTLDAIISGD
jgi:hypothetical protein